MANKGSIIIVDNDSDDQEIIRLALHSLDVKHELLFFDTCQETLDYLLVSPGQPFLILCDINLPEMSGLQFRELINQDDRLRRKSIPFIFLSTSNNSKEIQQAYDLTVQGYFKKPASFEELAEDLKLIIAYWTRCKHPNAA